MYKKLSLAVLAILFVLLGSAFASVTAGNIKLRVFESSSKHWIAVDPIEDDDATTKVEMIEASSNEWVEMLHNDKWGYYQMWSKGDNGFDLPISFRLTSEDGEEVILDNVMTEVKGAEELESAAKFARSVRAEAGASTRPGRPSWCPTKAPTQPATQAPTQAATQAPATQAPTQAATQAPATQAPTRRPTEAATQAPTRRPTEAATQAPTRTPTQPATQAPTRRPTEPATQAPTRTPTQPATQAPTRAPTTAPTRAPTTAPTRAPTTAPTRTPTTPPVTGDLCAVPSTSVEPVKILVPLYMYPNSDWDALVTAANGGAKIVAIINPSNGPISSGPSSTWTTYINKLKNAGIEVVGYVYTQYGSRSISTVKSDIDLYASKYPGVTGIFLDEAANDKATIPYYKQAYDHIMSKPGYVHDILNPGASTDQGYLAVSTNVVVYESTASSFKVPTTSWIKCAPSASQKAGYKYKFSAIVYGASSSQMSSMTSQLSAAGVGMVYITDRTLPNPYNPLPSYWSSEASVVKNL